MPEQSLSDEKRPAEKPFPWRCPKCGQPAVNRVTMPYRCQRTHNGRQVSVEVPNLAVPRCSNCGEVVFDYAADEQIRTAFRTQSGLAERAAPIMIEHAAFGTNNFAENSEPRIPCVLLLDVSGSMSGEPIVELNAGLMTYKDALTADDLASKRAETAIVTFGGQVRTVCDFTSAQGFQPPTLTASGDTPLGTAIRQGLEMLRSRKDIYRTHGISYYRPWVFLITDGGPTDEWRSAAEQVRQGETAKAFSFFVVGVGNDVQMDVLKQIAVREPLRLKGLRFRDFFLWLSSSLSAISRSAPGETVPFINPAAASNV